MQAIYLYIYIFLIFFQVYAPTAQHQVFPVSTGFCETGLLKGQQQNLLEQRVTLGCIILMHSHGQRQQQQHIYGQVTWVVGEVVADKEEGVQVPLVAQEPHFRSIIITILRWQDCQQLVPVEEFCPFLPVPISLILEVILRHRRGPHRLKAQPFEKNMVMANVFSK